MFCCYTRKQRHTATTFAKKENASWREAPGAVLCQQDSAPRGPRQLCCNVNSALPPHCAELTAGVKIPLPPIFSCLL